MRIQCAGANNSVEALEIANAVDDLFGEVISISTGGIEFPFIVWFTEVELTDVLALAKGRRD